MKKNYSFYSLLIAIPVALLLLVGFTGGQGGAFSGSPGDSNANCTQCHTPIAGLDFFGTPQLSGVPISYIAGTSYTLTLSIQGSAAPKYGFNITAEAVDQSNSKVGTWTPGTGSRLRDAGATDGLTHTSAGTSGSSWTFTWTAPTSNVGPITFYYATIQSNNRSGNSGDQMIIGNSAAVLSNGQDVAISSFNIYPTEAVDFLNIDLNQFDNGQVDIYNMSGVIVKQASLQQENVLDITGLSSGIYLANVSVNGTTTTERFIKK